MKTAASVQGATPPLRLIPLGGLGQIGMNCLALRQGDDILVIDCGVQYPEGDYGVEVVCPDFTWLVENRDRVCGLVITHGHEDHIGALAYFLGLVDPPLFAPAHAAALIRERLAEGGQHADKEIHVFKPGRAFQVGSFEVEGIAMTHSIVGAVALAVRTCAGIVVHSGDFKFDPEPMDQLCADESRLLELGDAGVALLLSDSTNVHSAGSSGSESEVFEALDEVISAAPQRVFVALFASNVHRLISLGRIAQKTGRRLCLLGRSLQRHADVAQRLGYVDWPKSLVLPADNLSSYPRAEVMVLTGGTQAESGSALARIAEGSHRFVSLLPEDTVVFSSRVIPGNERPVSCMVDALLRRGASVVTGRDRGVHASGHAYRDEQRHLINLLRPRAFMPVHGTLAHLMRHARLATEAGVTQILVLENGQTAALADNRLSRGGDVCAGTTPLGADRLPLSANVLQARRDLGRSGVVSLVIRKQQAGAACQVEALGYTFKSEADALLLAAAVEEFLAARCLSAGAALIPDVQRLARNWCVNYNNVRPGVIVHI